MGDMADWMSDQVELQALTHDVHPEKKVTCGFCGKRGLHWRLNRRGKWRLYDEEELRHACRRKAACAHEFPKCDEE